MKDIKAQIQQKEDFIGLFLRPFFKDKKPDNSNQDAWLLNINELTSCDQ